MASARRDDLAKRLAERLDKAPAKGRAMSAPQDDTPARPGTNAKADATPRPAERKRPQPTKQNAPKRATKQAAPSRSASEVSSVPTQRADVPAPRPRRGASGTVLRGHLVPDATHSEARRRKAALRSRRGTRVTWDDVMSEGLTLLVGQSGEIDRTLDAVRRSGDATVRRRLVQATLPSELDQRLVELQLDLSERPDTAATYEQLWTAAMLLWLDSTV